jgi:DNA-binding response OmpR family regulator
MSSAPLGVLVDRGIEDSALDLTLIAAILDAHGGRAWAEPGPGGAGLILATAWPLNPVLPTSVSPASLAEAKQTPPAPMLEGPAVALAVERERRVVLVVEADARVARYLRANLESQQLRTLVAHDADEARHLVDLEAPDLLVLDGGLPGMDDCRLLNQLVTYAGAPILVLAHHADALACARALDHGAADWMARPFSMDELVARIRAALRTHASRLPAERVTRFTCGDLAVDFTQHSVTVGGRSVGLSKTEYKMLRLLAQHPDMVLSHDVLLERVWGPGYNDAIAFLWVYVRRLRSKLEPDPAHPRYILTVPGVGYRLAREAHEPQR